MRNLSFIFWVLVFVDVSPSGHVKTDEDSNKANIEQYSGMNVFVAVADGVKTIIVMEGDSVTLNTNVTEIKSHDTVLWMFGDDIIAKMNKAAEMFTTSEEERFRDRLELDKQTGSLTIRKIRTEHTGHYQLKIKSTTETSKKFSVTVRDLPQSSHWLTTGPVLAVSLFIVIVITIAICFAVKTGRLDVRWSCKKNDETTDNNTIQPLNQAAQQQ